uniref:Uncharacterized protein n=1 Tax=Astyanax mexicanus TaxID=7994 RepID=A0A3B1JWE2_ASTMX
MRRSAAPSQLQGNAVKRQRFIPPAPSQTGVLGNGINKVTDSKLVRFFTLLHGLHFKGA